MESKYTLIRVLGVISKILGIITAIMTILGAIGAIAGAFMGSDLIGPILDQYGLGFGQGQYMGMVLGVVGSIMTLLYGGSLAIALYAFGQGIQLLTDIEKNTRTTIAMLQRQVGSQIAA